MIRTTRRSIGLRTAVYATFVAAAVLSVCPIAYAITLGQVDNFQAEDDTANWFGTELAQQDNVGPNGTGDHSLQATAFGSGSHGKLVMQNFVQWTGDWTGAGVAQISFDIRNPNAVPLTIRLGIAGPNGFFGGGTGDTYVTLGQPLAADNLWHHLSFDVTAGAFEYVGGLEDPTSIEGSLAEVVTFRILHNSNASFIGEEIEGDFFIDNITAEAAAVENTGDYNNDGIVDGADYVMWRKTLTLPADPDDSDADGDGDGTVDLDDYGYWVERFGNVVPQELGGGSTVPEPATLMLALACALVGTMSPRLRSRRTSEL
jgi:hypothetical protein